ncbi:PREDICTED: F-box protein At1g31080-like [Camelina sativa]|uniref:F-box protein At1g31080-like n=1 Tax=Camelina sativa TaxID=90675 RepID=A0ABM0XEY4_CAMSA|nr:PREDICTED: F-box protein At1g31080-like [Camelina sativa]
MSNGETFDSIPTDLFNEIFSRLPAKSISRFRCVSKLWDSMLSSPSFTELFLTRSWARPRLLFAIKQPSEWRFFSSPQNPDDDDKSSLEVAATDCHVDFPGKSMFRDDCTCSYTSGLLCFPNVPILENKGGDVDQCVICNPATGQRVFLPKQKTTGVSSRFFLGFDTIDKRFKVLHLVEFSRPHSTIPHRFCFETVHYILTLGTGKMSWREISCPLELELYPFNKGICINGFLYYLAKRLEETDFVVVCFDVRSEKFKFVDASCFNDQACVTLVNYKGKLGGIYWMHDSNGGITNVQLCVWILEDVKKHEWSNYVYTFGDGDLGGAKFDCVIGVTSTGEIVSSDESEPIRVLYFNSERNTVKIVQIQGFECGSLVHAFVDHVEDLNANYAEPLKSSLNIIEKRAPSKPQQQGSRASSGKQLGICKFAAPSIMKTLPTSFMQNSYDLLANLE